jgi:hypothetical protein
VIAAPHQLHSTDFVAPALPAATRYSAWMVSMWQQSHEPPATIPTLRLHLLYQTILV